MDGKGEQRGRARGTSRRLARFGGFELDVRSAELRKPGGAPVRLSEQPFRILLVLLEHPQEVVLRDELRTRLWPNNTIVEFEHSLNAAVNRLRQVLGDSADKPRFIETLARRGYRFMGSVEWVDLPPPSSIAAAPSLPTGMAGLTGRKVAHYRLLEVLGGGGMGVVYKAEDLKLGRSVALKFLGEEFSHEGREAQRLHREARALSGLDHPNICTVYEVGEHDGRPFIAMQWLDGETLRQRIESAPGRSAFTLAELLETAVCILAGLEAAHEKGIIHRDVKPANIFLTTRGGVKLLDFGLAKAVREADIPPETVITGPPGRAHSNSLTLTGATMGTASYMAPEQVRGETADARSDLFSFGVVLYEMATGRQPFSGATLDQIHAAVLAYSPPPAHTLNPEIPAALEAVVEKALQKDPERRFQSAHEMLEPLEALRRPARARVESPASPADAVPRRRFAIGAGIALAASLLLGLSWLVQSRLSAPQESIPGRMAVERLTDSGRVENVAISRDGRNLAYTQREGDGVGLWLRRLADHRETPLLPASESTGYRGLTFAPAGDAIYVVRHDTLDTALRYLYVVPAKGGPARKLVEDIDSPVGFSPDGRRLVYTRGIPSASATEIRIADADGGANHVLATVPDTFPDYQPGPAWSPDGRVITTAVMHLRARPRYALLSVDARTGTFSELLPSDFPIGRPLWLPGGEEMLVILQDEELRGQLWGISYPGIATRKLSTDLADYGGRADLDGDGDRLVTIARSANANVWTASASDQWRGHQLTALSSPLRDVLDAPGGGMLVIDGNHIWHLSADGHRREPFTGFQKPMAFARCGPFVVIVQERSEGSELLRVDATGTGALSLAAGDLSLPVCSRDGAWVYYLEFTPFKRIWRVAVTGGRPQQVSRVLGDTVEGRLSLSPDGKILAYAFSETRPTPRTRFALVPTAGGPPVRLLDLPGAVQHGSTGSPILSPDGTRVQFLIVKDGVSNVWQQLLDGGGQYPLTQFNSGRIFDFNWSGDGKTLLLTRGDVSSDAVLIRRPGAGRRKSGEAASGAVNGSQRPSVVARSPADRAAITTSLNLSEPSAPADWDGRGG